jgi:hypothetical protein
MAESGKFNQLAANLSIEERGRLLKKLSGQSSISKDPLYDFVQESLLQTLEAQYEQLPWYEHLWFLVVGFFRNKSPVKVFEDRLVSKTGQEIDSKFPGYFDYRHNLLLPLFHKELTGLKENVRFFKDAFDASVNRDRGAFYAFLGSLEMQEVHKRLEEETLPMAIATKHPEAKDMELKQIAFDMMENAFAAINEDQRNAMYNNARSLSCLKELAFFLFDRVLYAFAFDSSVAGMACSASVVRDQIAALNNILFSLKEPPSMALLESLFIFVLQEQTTDTGTEDMDIDAEGRELLSRAENSLVTIREFNHSIPLTLILRFANRNTALNPTTISGGEDWFTVYREYWKQHIEECFDDFLRSRRKRELLESFRSFLKGADLRSLENVESEINPSGIPIRMAYNLSFLLTFHSIVFITEVNKVLRPILLEGEFIKRENRTLFTESYNDLMKLDEDIRKFDQDISSAGEIGKQYAAAQADMSLTNRRRKVQTVVEGANDVANNIVNEARKAIDGMLVVLKGIARKEPDGKNEMLSNMSKFIGKPPASSLFNVAGGNTPTIPAAFTPKGIAFFNGINEVIASLQKAAQILDNIDALGLG